MSADALAMAYAASRGLLPKKRSLTQASSARHAAQTKKAAPKPAPKPAPAPRTYTSPGYSTNYSPGYGGATNAAPIVSTPSPPPAPPKPKLTGKEWIAKGADASYQAQLAALKQALSDREAANESRKENYIQDYTRSLGDLGWDSGAGEWRPNDQTTDYGRSFTNQIGDFASRGMLVSTPYANSLTDLNETFNKQRDRMQEDKSSFLDSLAQSLAAYQNQQESQKKMAQSEALARYAAKYGV